MAFAEAFTDCRRVIVRLLKLSGRVLSRFILGPASLHPPGGTPASSTASLAPPAPGWKPSTPDCRGSALDELTQRHPAVAVHFWAIWDRHDLTMDQLIQAVKEQFSDRVFFASCNTDLPENVDFTHRCGVVTIPYLGLFFAGQLRYGIVGLRSAEELASDLEYALSEPKRPARRWAFWRSSSERPGFVWY